MVPICLDTKKFDDIPLEKQIVAGWGRTNGEGLTDQFGRGGAASSKLMKVETPFIPIDECKKRFPFFRRLDNDTLICAGGLEGKDSCNGDSGGPLITYKGFNDQSDTKYLLGIVSFGSSKCGGVSTLHLFHSFNLEIRKNTIFFCRAYLGFIPIFHTIETG